MEKLNTYIKRLIKFVIYGQPIVHTEAKIINLGVNNLLEGRTALITGASSGIGLSIAKSFAQAGANIVMAGRNMEKLQKVSQCVKEQSDKGIDIQCLAFDIKQAQTYKSMIIDTSKIVNAIGEYEFVSPKEGLKKCMIHFLQNPEFNWFDARQEGLHDRYAHEYTSLASFRTTKQKGLYLIYRYVPFADNILNLIRKARN